MSSPTLVHAPALCKPTLVVPGRDGTGKPRALWFDAVSAELPTKAAGPMKTRGMEALATENRYDVPVSAGLSSPPQPPSPALIRS
jgi:hypothetical protein